SLFKLLFRKLNGLLVRGQGKHCSGHCKLRLCEFARFSCACFQPSLNDVPCLFQALQLRLIVLPSLPLIPQFQIKATCFESSILLAGLDLGLGPFFLKGRRIGLFTLPMVVKSLAEIDLDNRRSRSFDAQGKAPGLGDSGADTEMRVEWSLFETGSCCGSLTPCLREENLMIVLRSTP